MAYVAEVQDCRRVGWRRTHGVVLLQSPAQRWLVAGLTTVDMGDGWDKMHMSMIMAFILQRTA